MLRKFASHAENRVSRCFTLVELLVVVAVIAILFAMLLPALQSAKGRGVAIACTGNLKQVVTAALLYATDYDGRFLMGSYASTQVCYSESLTYGNYLPANSKDLHCPGVPYTAAHNLEKYMTYGGNMTTSLPYALPLSQAGFSWVSCYTLYNCATPARSSIFADTIHRAGSSYSAFQTYRYWNAALTAEGGVFLGHSGLTGNIAAVDGHVEACNAQSLRNFDVTAYIDRYYNEYY